MADLQVRGPLWGSTGAPVPLTASRSGAQRVTDAHAKYMDTVLSGNVYSTGMTTTAITNATFTTATTGVTATPIVGVWNPLNSGKNLVILQAKLNSTVTAATATGAGAFVWMFSLNNTVITTGLSPFNHLTLQQTGSVAKGFANTALTGMTGTLALLTASGLTGGVIGNFSQVGTAVGFVPGPIATIEYIDGCIIVPPGAVLSLQCTTTPVAISCASSLIWEEVPIFT